MVINSLTSWHRVLPWKHAGVAKRARRGRVPVGQVVSIVGEKLGDPTARAEDVDADIGILLSPTL